MGKFLSDAQVHQYQKNGFLSNLRVLSESAAEEIRERLESFEKKQSKPLYGAQRHKTHLLFPWLNELIRQEKIVDAIEDIYGENILCWTCNFFIKEAQDPSHDRHVPEYANRVYVIERGEIVFTGSVTEATQNSYLSMKGN